MSERYAAANAEAKLRILRGLRGEGAHLPFDAAVHDFPDSLINVRPANVPYTFWHQLEHIRICQEDILRYILDPEYVSPEWPREYWPVRGAEADRPAWQQTIKKYRGDRDEFIALVERDETDILAPVVHNAGRSIMGSALVAIDHAAYHIGEFVMGRQIMGAWESELG